MQRVFYLFFVTFTQQNNRIYIYNGNTSLIDSKLLVETIFNTIMQCVKNGLTAQ
jgi:hypothetical protein